MIRHKSAVFVAVVLGALGVATAAMATTSTTSSTGWLAPKPPGVTKSAPMKPITVKGAAHGHSTVGFWGTCASDQVFQHGQGKWSGPRTGPGTYQLDVCADVTYGDQITAKVTGTMHIAAKRGSFDATVVGQGTVNLANESATYDYTATVVSGPHAGTTFHLRGKGKATSIDFDQLVAHMTDSFTYTGTVTP